MLIGFPLLVYFAYILCPSLLESAYFVPIALLLALLFGPKTRVFPFVAIR